MSETTRLLELRGSFRHNNPVVETCGKYCALKSKVRGRDPINHAGGHRPQPLAAFKLCWNSVGISTLPGLRHRTVDGSGVFARLRGVCIFRHYGFHRSWAKTLSHKIARANKLRRSYCQLTAQQQIPSLMVPICHAFPAIMILPRLSRRHLHSYYSMKIDQSFLIKHISPCQLSKPKPLTITPPHT